jgi:NAD(P)-dependent dehydrogenase (short-subunit alcohol dehydrogenase family)
MSEIRGAVAVITGAGSGIGRALALNMASHGSQLALADVNAAALEETRKLLGQATARTYAVDVSSAAAVEDFARRVEQDFGRASLLINNAGVALFGTFAELTLEEFDWLIRINFWGVIYGCKFFLPMLLKEKDARIVNISSVFGLFGPPGQTAYCSSKWAVRGFSDSLREELRATPVKVTCVHPAGIATNVAVNARLGEATRPADHDVALERFKKGAQIPPASAAQTIVEGILRDRDRVLIGRDAYFIDRLARLFPARASAMLTNWLLKRTENKQAGAPAPAPSDSKATS